MGTWNEKVLTHYALYDFTGHCVLRGTIHDIADFLEIKEQSVYVMMKRQRENPDVARKYTIEKFEYSPL